MTGSRSIRNTTHTNDKDPLTLSKFFNCAPNEAPGSRANETVIRDGGSSEGDVELKNVDIFLFSYQWK